MPPWKYATQAFGMTGVPMFAFCGIAQEHRKAAFVGFMAPLCVFCVCVTVFYSPFLGSSYRSLGYQGVDTSGLLDGQAISYAGAMLLLVAIWRITISPNRNSIGMFVACLIASGFGAVCLLLGESRGAVVALAVGVGTIAWYGRGRAVPLRRALAVAPIVALLVVMFTVLGTSMVGRTMDVVDGLRDRTDDAGSNRVGIWKAAAHAFCNHPLTGSGLEVPNTGTHAHNAIVGAYMATGIVGGTAFAVLLFLGVRAAGQIMKSSSSLGWVALVFINSVCASMVSGDIYSRSLWFSLVAVCAIPKGAAREQALEPDSESNPRARQRGCARILAL